MEQCSPRLVIRPSRAFHSRAVVAAEDRAQGVDRRLPQIGPRASWAHHEGDLQLHSSAGKWGRCADLIANLRLVGGRPCWRGGHDVERVVPPGVRGRHTTPDRDRRRRAVVLRRPDRGERETGALSQARGQREEVVVEVVQPVQVDRTAGARRRASARAEPQRRRASPRLLGARLRRRRSSGCAPATPPGPSLRVQARPGAASHARSVA